MSFEAFGRNMVLHPYTNDEKRIVNWLFELTNNAIGGGDDPIGFFIASYESLLHERKELKQHVAALQLDNDRLHALMTKIEITSETSMDDLGELSYQIGNEIARRVHEEREK